MIRSTALSQPNEYVLRAAMARSYLIDYTHDASNSTCFSLQHELLDELVVIRVRQRHGRSVRELLLVLGLLLQVDLHLGRRKRKLLDEHQRRISHQLAGQVQERLLIVVVGLCRHLVILQVLFPVERHLLRLHLAVFHIHLISHQHHRNILAHPRQVPVPRRHVLVRQPRRHVKHNDGRIRVDVVPVAEPTELLLSGCIPAVKANLSAVRGEVERVHLNPDGRLVLLLKLSRQVTLDERRLPGSSISHEHQLERRHTVRGGLSW
mmetsp:Transcript_10451/g.28578  ORF Transcript_10451/g.28578 Transcript_10451/m.28578 type:complete len:264 (-) Transcript_10451:93-884(-)